MIRIYRECWRLFAKGTVVLPFLLSVSTVFAAEEFARDELRGIVVDVKPPLKVEGTKKDNELKLIVKLESKELCFGQIYLEDGEKNAVVPYKLSRAKRFPFGIGIGIGIGLGGKRGSRGDEPKEIYRGNPEGTYIQHGARKSGSGGGFGVGIDIPLFGLFKGKECQRDIEAHFVLPKGRERLEEWKLVLAVVNAKNEEERLILSHLSETEGEGANGRKGLNPVSKATIGV
jgi:hypothetical protein